MNHPIPWWVNMPGKNIDTMIYSILNIVDGVTGILSLGFWSTDLTTWYIFRRTLSYYEKEIEKNNGY